MAKGDDLQERLVEFAVAVMDLCDKLPKTPAGTHIAGQLLRSGSSAAPNYAETRGAESTRDFVHKLGLVLKELNESRVWLQIIGTRNLTQASGVQDLSHECDELCRIIAASRRTAETNMRLAVVQRGLPSNKKAQEPLG